MECQYYNVHEKHYRQFIRLTKLIKFIFRGLKSTKSEE